ncbi:MAG: GNAT family N-acetyltransferase [Candidatus Eremiobacteraeota bacterium]|nr:GNAT family N-acetyltransferase [Candidatus Eremiobacteraeota bacterium]MBC5827490.1 GNAT family N-acetyltransferase [Candidatus Eremiobacteraeota bacterium]
MITRAVEETDAQAWTRMRHLLWPDEDRAELASDVASYFAGTSKFIVAAFIALDDSGVLVGFLELGLRPYAEGCIASPVPHVEGWLVLEQARGRGVGRSLISAAEGWATAHGYRELTSDGLLGNELGYRAHIGAGFVEVERLIAFHKTLHGDGPVN